MSNLFSLMDDLVLFDLASMCYAHYANIYKDGCRSKKTKKQGKVKKLAVTII